MEVTIDDPGDNQMMSLFMEWYRQVTDEPLEEPERLTGKELAENLFEEGVISKETRDEIKEQFAGCVLTDMELIQNVAIDDSTIVNIVPDKYTGTLHKYMQQMADKLANRGIEIEWTGDGPVEKKTGMDLSMNFMYPNVVDMDVVLNLDTN